MPNACLSSYKLSRSVHGGGAKYGEKKEEKKKKQNKAEKTVQQKCREGGRAERGEGEEPSTTAAK